MIFEIGVFAFMVISTLIVGSILYYAEGKKQSYFYYVFHAWLAYKFIFVFRAQIFFVGDIKLASTLGRIVEGLFLFTILIIFTNFTAVIAANMGLQQTLLYG